MRAHFILPMYNFYPKDKQHIMQSLLLEQSLCRLADHIQDQLDTRIVDERSEMVNLLDKPDIVVILAHYANAARAYLLADFYRARGVFVMLMGSHVTSFPNEACEHADSIFVGPWDGAFKTFIEDFKKGVKRRLYCAPSAEAAVKDRYDFRDRFNANQVV
jgi:hypothetical protein